MFWFARMHLLQVCQHSSDISLFTLHLPKTKKNTSRNSAQTIAKSSILYPECRNHKIWNQSLCIFCETFHLSQKTRSHISLVVILLNLSLHPRGGDARKIEKGAYFTPYPGQIGLRKNWTRIFIGPRSDHSLPMSVTN